MTPKQKIELRLSEVRSRLNEIAGVDELTDELRQESATLQTEFADLETRHRAAIVAESSDESVRGEQATDDGEGAELRALVAGASVGAVFAVTVEHRATDGRTAELQQHFGLPSNAVPLRLLQDSNDADRRREHRAVTPAPSDVGQMQSPIIPGVFPRAAASWLSVDMPTVGTGEQAFPVLTENAAVGTPNKSAPQAETTGAFVTTLLSPKRVQASFFYAREDRARFMGMDEALRANLSDALSDKLDERILNLLFTTTAISEIASTGAIDLSSYMSSLFGQIDGTFAWGADDLRILVGAPTLALMATSYVESAGSISLYEHLRRQSAGIRVSAHVPAVASMKQDTLVRRGMRRDAVAPVWDGVTLIPDEVTKASTGEIVLTAVMMAAWAVVRGGGFKRIETDHSS